LWYGEYEYLETSGIGVAPEKRKTRAVCPDVPSARWTVARPDSLEENQLSNTRIEKIILRHTKLKPADRHLALVILAVRNTKTGVCTTEQGKIAELCGKNRYWVMYHTRRLQSAGILVKVTDRTKDGRFTILRHYFLDDLNIVQELASMCKNQFILDDLQCIPIILKQKKCTWIEPLLEAAEKTLF
jgi:hypothetical protein